MRYYAIVNVRGTSIYLSMSVSQCYFVFFYVHFASLFFDFVHFVISKVFALVGVVIIFVVVWCPQCSVIAGITSQSKLSYRNSNAMLLRKVTIYRVQSVSSCKPAACKQSLNALPFNADFVYRPTYNIT